MGVLLEVKDLKKHFQVRQGTLHAVDGVSFTIDEGKTLGVVGESGCGKSTLGRVVLHLLDSTDGKIFFQGEDITKVDNKRLRELRKDAQMIFQDPYSSINPRMSVGQIIEEPLKINKMCNSKAEYKTKVKELMDTVGLAERVYRSFPHELDGGRRQRVGIARALSVSPKFIVCDEPVSALDVSIQAQILNLLQDVQRDLGLTYIFITHDLSVVKHISDDICVMYLGVVVEKCSKSVLFKKPFHPYTKALLSAILPPRLIRDREQIILRGEIISPINVKDGCRFAPRCQYAGPECHDSNQQLVEVENGHFVACNKVREINDLR